MSAVLFLSLWDGWLSMIGIGIIIIVEARLKTMKFDYLFTIIINLVGLHDDRFIVFA
jgi:hypothetical protein